MTKISIFGMGYVGCILVAGYSHFGFDVIVVDIDKKKNQVVWHIPEH